MKNTCKITFHEKSLVAPNCYHFMHALYRGIFALRMKKMWKEGYAIWAFNAKNVRKRKLLFVDQTM